VLRHDVWRAKAKDVGSLIARLASIAVRQLDVASWATKAAWCGVGASMTSPRIAIRQQ
jgi:hypothetical protein